MSKASAKSSQSRTKRRISSGASVDGPSLFGSPDGQTVGQCGQGPPPVSRFPTPARNAAWPTPATCGHSSSASSISTGLQSFLASKLRQRMDVNGSPECVLTWKDWDIGSGPLICALRARRRHTSDSAFSGLPSPAEQNSDGGPNPEGNTGERFTLQTAAVLSTFPSPNCNERGSESRESKDNRGAGGLDLQSTVLAAFPTPTSLSFQDTPGMATEAVNPDGSIRSRLDQLPRQAAAILGETSSSSTVPMAKRGVLNPDLPRWLMGFPRTHERLSPGFRSWVLVLAILRESSGRRSLRARGGCRAMGMQLLRS